jgi:uncharacterized cupredoxin-like copper-binding protein
MPVNGSGIGEGARMIRNRVFSGALTTILAVAFIVALAACGGAKAAEVKVSITEWSITSGVAQISAGKVQFVVANAGKEPHEFVIIKSDLSVDALPVVEGKVDEQRVQLIDEIEPFAGGATEKITVDLKAARYILICNIVEKTPGEPVESHYLQGMRAAFTVNP